MSNAGVTAMRIELHEGVQELTELRRRAGEITQRMRREADLLADVHHRLVELVAAIGSQVLVRALTSELLPSSRQTVQTPSLPKTNLNSQPALLRIGAVAGRLGLSRSQVWRMVKEGRFPKPRRVSTRAVAWLEPEVTAWIAGRPVFDGPGQPPHRVQR
jgi:prophage regulatory protein